MKLQVQFSDLWNNVQKMGAKIVNFSISSTLEAFDESVFTQELSTKKGLEVTIHDIAIENHLLLYKGKQVILFIPDQGLAITSVIHGSRDGKKFHVSDCKTIEEMKKANRLDRYRVTTNLTGWFHVFGKNQYGILTEGEAQLQVCKNCLDKLNYKGAQRSPSLRNKIVQTFSIEEFLESYKTFFKKLPNEKNPNNISGYVQDWKERSQEYRQRKNFICENCLVDLSLYKHLLDTHHINGVKTDNSDANLRALCKECHSLEPKHEHMSVPYYQIRDLDIIRIQQGKKKRS